ncbi:allantoate amidohydrolase [Ancylobacter sp. 6x-1]|uniref:Allantoate amidohydrolase n=1 Tax=Ancylobacter crimeensis TaxID=2579147 RepID=A0ABT0D5Z9_9HYPH|nr:allantoate amidohydrolase [Ancylobacter crimeensis]MCK0195369.1 allantoate amidohydrolase [Ancylobacter crimeensis]
MTTRADSHINGDGLTVDQRLDALAAISDTPVGLTRLYLGPAHRRATTCVADWMQHAGMDVRLDSTGNVVGRYAGTMPEARTLILASHIDTVANAGRFDGNLGVVAAIEVVRRLHDAGRHLPFAIEVVAFGDEEGVRFASALGGSRALAGRFDPAILEERDGEGISRREALIAFGCDPTAIASEARDPATTLGYVELHIEQGPVLEREDLPLAVVTAINGANRGRVTVTGESGHAGTVPMPIRRDALAASAEMMLAVERLGRSAPDLVATVGRLDINHAAPNTVPGRVSFTLDVRAPDDAVRAEAVAAIGREILVIAAARGVSASVEIGYEAPAAQCDDGLQQRLAASMARLGLPERRMPSGAGHDAMAFAGRIPFAMLFVRCRGGISHNPAEYAAPDDIEAGVRVLADFIDHFAI